MHVVRLQTTPCSTGWLLTTTMSSRRFPWSPLRVPRIFKAKETKSKVSNEHQLRFCKLLDNLLRPGAAWKWTSNRLGNDGVYFWGGPRYGNGFQGGGERIDSYPASSLTHIGIQISSENPREVVPSTAQYIMDIGKQTLKVLQSAAAFIPVPLIREAVGVALKIMEVCEEQCEVCKISPRKCCKIINNILLPGYIRCR